VVLVLTLGVEVAQTPSQVADASPMMGLVGLEKAMVKDGDAGCRTC
jgi:hypothetical protein